jgi:hypothetical protein
MRGLSGFRAGSTRAPIVPKICAEDHNLVRAPFGRILGTQRAWRASLGIARRRLPLTLISARGRRIRGELVDVSIRGAEVLPRIAIRHYAQLAEQLNVGCAHELVSCGLDVVD